MNKKVFVLTALVTLGGVGAIGLAKYRSIQAQISAMQNMVVPPVVVSDAAAIEQSWPNTLLAVGSLSSHQGIMVRNELEGLILDVPAVSGATVDKGALLVALDTSLEEAELAGLTAQAKLAELSLKRARELRQAGTNAPSDLDAAEAAQAQAQAAVETLRINIGKKQIRAPFPGRLGIVKVYPGQFLGKAEALVQLESVDPMHVDFSLPQQELRQVRVGQQVHLRIDAFPGRVFSAEVSAVSPRVADATRMADIRATLPNPGGILSPGMFAQTEVQLPADDRAVVIPSAAVTYNPYGDTVFVVEKGVATQRFVKVSSSRGDVIRVESGLKPGERVVTSGQSKLRNGSAVKVDNQSAPEANPAPKPSES